MHYSIFPTVKGWLGIAFTNTGLYRLILPSPDRGQVEQEMLFSLDGELQEVEDTSYAPLLQRYFAGEPVDLALPVDWSWTTPFQRQVLELVKQIPYGKTETYGSIAGRLGKPQSARAVGGALSRNQVPLVIPCHRVLAAGHKALGGFTSRNGLADKIALLRLEGAFKQEVEKVE